MTAYSPKLPREPGEASANAKSPWAKLIKATGWSTLASVFNLISQIVRAKLAATLLGPQGIAILSQLNGFLGISQVLGGVGHSNGFVRDTSIACANQNDEEIGEIQKTFLSTLILSSITTSLICFCLADQISVFLFGHTDYVAWVKIVSVGIPLSIGTRYFQGILKGFRRVRSLAISSFIGNAIGIIAFIFLIYFWRLTGAVTALIVFQLALCIAAIYFGYKESALKGFRYKFRLEILARNIGFAIGGLSVGLLGTLAGLIVVRLIIQSFGEDIAGLYSASWRFSSVYLGLLFATTTSYFFPTVAKLEQGQIADEIDRTIRLFLYVLTPAMVLLVCFAKPIIWLLLSPEFYDSGILLSLQMPGNVFRLTFDILALTLLARGLPMSFVAKNVLRFVAYVGLVALCIFNDLSVQAVCIAYSIGYFAVTCVAFVWVPSQLDIRLKSSTFYALISASIFVTAASLIMNFVDNEFIQMAAGLAIAMAWAVIVARNPAAKRSLSKLMQRFKKSS